MKGLNQQEIFLCAFDSHTLFFKEAKAKNHLLTWVECSWWATWRSTLEQIIKVFQFGFMSSAQHSAWSVCMFCACLYGAGFPERDGEEERRRTRTYEISYPYGLLLPHICWGLLVLLLYVPSHTTVMGLVSQF